MTLALEQKIADSFRAIRPREGFEAGLLAVLIHEPVALHPLESFDDRARKRWLVVGAVAGVVSATGAVVIGARRRHRGAA